MVLSDCLLNDDERYLQNDEKGEVEQSECFGRGTSGNGAVRDIFLDIAGHSRVQVFGSGIGPFVTEGS